MATYFDQRSNTREKPIWEISITQMTWENPAHDEQTESLAMNGQITQIIWTTGDSGAADVDVVFEVQDALGNIMFTTTENDNTVAIDVAGGDFADNQLTMNNFIISAHPDGPPSAGSTLTVDAVIRGI